MLPRRLSFLPLLLALAGSCAGRGPERRRCSPLSGAGELQPDDGRRRRPEPDASLRLAAAAVRSQRLRLRGAYVDPDSSKGCPTGSPETCKRDNYTLFPIQLQFFQNALNQPDQLRQRTALALSRSWSSPGNTIKLPNAMANYQRIFLRKRLRQLPRHPQGGDAQPHRWAATSTWPTTPGQPTRPGHRGPTRTTPARCCSCSPSACGELNLDGTPRLGSTGQPSRPRPGDRRGFAHAFTGWTYAPAPRRHAQPIRQPGLLRRR